MIDIYQIEGPWHGPLAVCMRPRPVPWLHDDLRHLARRGYHVLVSALTPNEVDEASLGDVPAACAEHGLHFAHVPIPNLGVPPVEVALPALTDWLAALRQGRGVAIHCFGGVGRSPTLAAALLVLEGVSPGEAWRRVERARGREVPDTHEQRAWVESLFASLHGAA
ncbi:MAG: hypothetical protein Kow0010_06960 [Dehalococcoidia bacterium]